MISIESMRSVQNAENPRYALSVSRIYEEIPDMRLLNYAIRCCLILDRSNMVSLN